MPSAIRIYKTGNADVLNYEAIETPELENNEVLIRQTAIGLNFIDTYHRTGLYPVEMPFTPGLEGAGVIEKIGAEVANFKIGDRIAYASGPIGAYATHRTMPAARIVKIPDAIDDKTTAAALVKGMTVEYLLERTYPVKAGETILIHAAAGGVGSIAVQWAKALGATVIGTVGSDEKADKIKALGADHVILYKNENIAERVKDITNGKGLPVVYDSVGKDTFEASLDCLAPRGTLVSFGNASGPVENVNLGILATKGSLYVTRPSLVNYTSTREEYTHSAARVFEMIKKGAINIEINQEYSLKEAAQAHKDLENRKTTGSTILLP